MIDLIVRFFLATLALIKLLFIAGVTVAFVVPFFWAGFDLHQRIFVCVAALIPVGIICLFVLWEFFLKDI